MDLRVWLSGTSVSMMADPAGSRKSNRLIKAEVLFLTYVAKDYLLNYFDPVQTLPQPDRKQ